MRTFFFLACFLLGAFHSPASLCAQNSTEKLREQPSATAAKAGLAIHWRTDVEAALKEAKREKKPVFWYVPTIEGSFMDRQAEVDGYMMAGPFSWPWLVELLNERYVPVKAKADRKLCKTYGLAPVSFIEPGILILPTARGAKRRTFQALSTFSPSWFRYHFLSYDDTSSPWPVEIQEAYITTCYTTLPQADDGLERFDKFLETMPEAERPGALWMFAAGLRNYQRGAQAREILQRLKKGYPENPLAAKAAMELEGHGPYWQGFETYDTLPAVSLHDRIRGTRLEKGLLSDAEILVRSQAYLLRMQEADGSWRDSRYDFGGTDSMPNVHAAITAIIARGLAGHRPPPDQADQPEADVSVSLQRAYAFLAQDDILNLQDSDELLWAYLYRIRLYTYLLDREHTDREAILPLLTRNVDALMGLQGDKGAWAHEYENPFVTASALIALYEAQRHGVEPQDLDEVVERGLIALEASRSKDGAYSYYQGRGKVRTPVEASVGRSPVGEHARQLWGVAKKKDLNEAIANSFEHEEPLFLARKYDDHTSTHAYGGFFFWYSMLGRTEAILALPKGKKRTQYRKRQRDLILGLPEIDGAFIDSHELGRCYGTGMALWCLDLLEQD